MPVLEQLRKTVPVLWVVAASGQTEPFPGTGFPWDPYRLGNVTGTLTFPVNETRSPLWYEFSLLNPTFSGSHIQIQHFAVSGLLGYSLRLMHGDQTLAYGTPFWGGLGLVVNRIDLSGIPAGTYRLRVERLLTSVYTVLPFLHLEVLGQESTRPNLVPHPPRSGWPDKLLVLVRPEEPLSTGPYFDDQELYVSWAVLNDSTIPIGTTFRSELYVDGTFRQAWLTSGLNGRTFTTLHGHNLGRLSAGVHTLRLVTDSGNDVEESNESDNSAEKSITVIARTGGRPNLVIHQPEGWPDKLMVSSIPGTNRVEDAFYDDQDLYLNWTVRNDSTVPIGTGFRTELRMNGELRHVWITAALDAGAFTAVRDFPLGRFSAGHHTLQLVTDSTREVSELDETDNTSEKTIHVTARSTVPSGIVFAIAFNDPDGAATAYYPAIEANLLAACADWARYLRPPDGNGRRIELEVRFSGQPTIVSGSATSAFVKEEAGLQIFEQGVAAEIRTGFDPNGPLPDGWLNLGTNYLREELWLDPDPANRSAPVPPERTDAYSVFLHELGHVLAFSGWRNADTGTPPGNYLSSYDAQVKVEGGGLVFTGNAATALYGGYIPLTRGHLSHLGNPPPGPGADLSADLMSGVALRRGTRYFISPLDLAILADVGLPVTRALAPPKLTGLTRVFGGSVHLTWSGANYNVRVLFSPALSNFVWQPVTDWLEGTSWLHLSVLEDQSGFFRLEVKTSP